MAASRASVAGLHEIYTSFGILLSAIHESTDRSQPFRGGSNIIELTEWQYFGSRSSTFPHKNDVLCMELREAFLDASSIASGTDSIPITLLQKGLKRREIVPAPQ